MTNERFKHKTRDMNAHQLQGLLKAINTDLRRIKIAQFKQRGEKDKTTSTAHQKTKKATRHTPHTRCGNEERGKKMRDWQRLQGIYVAFILGNIKKKCECRVCKHLRRERKNIWKDQ